MSAARTAVAAARIAWTTPDGRPAEPPRDGGVELNQWDRDYPGPSKTYRWTPDGFVEATA